MPELPEVENVRQNLMELGLVGREILDLQFHRPDLRTRFDLNWPERVRGYRIAAIERRAKFLIFHSEEFAILSHLGMSGSWRKRDLTQNLEKHDHVSLKIQDGTEFVFNDPRRFGIFEVWENSDLPACRWFRHLGVEPLNPKFNGDYLYQISRGSQQPVKTFLMDQKRVVGVGNIYASEVLFRALVRPSRRAHKLTREECVRIASSIKTILKKAIQNGGSTIRTYRNSKGEAGNFQNRFKVYERDGRDCLQCGGLIRISVQAGRSTYWCPKCQC